MRVALDTNVLAYAEGVNGARRKTQTLDLLQRLPEDSMAVPVQALGELFAVLVRKASRAPPVARAAVLSWRDAYPLIETTVSVMRAAADLAADHELFIWDAVMLSAAAEADCRLLLSEDLQEGFTWNGVTVTNPFAARRHALLEAMLGE